MPSASHKTLYSGTITTNTKANIATATATSFNAVSIAGTRLNFKLLTSDPHLTASVR